VSKLYSVFPYRVSLVDVPVMSQESLAQ
jgi:hypothetical protein